MRLSWHARMFVLIVSQAAFSPGARGDIERTILLLYLSTLKETREVPVLKSEGMYPSTALSTKTAPFAIR
jgi:hypothetical protein